MYSCLYCFELDTADARLRIVSERVDIIDNLILSVSVIIPFDLILARCNV
jgi:hypothetical protein